MKQYRLLRNNKESGPYTAEQLIQTGLKAYDLIWLEGRSAAWRYPCELEELKPYAPAVEEQPFDRFYKRPSSALVKKEKPAVAENLADAGYISTISSVVNLPAEQPFVKQKPRIKIKADWNKLEPVVAVKRKEITAPEPLKQAVFIKNTATEIPTWKDAWLDWEQEKKAVTAVSKNNVQVSHPAEDAVLETKFSQSLGDIKEKYAETFLKAKTKTSDFSWNRYKAYVSLALICLPLIGFGVWLGVKLNGTATNADAIIKSQQEKLQNILPAQSVAVTNNNQLPVNDGNSKNVDENKQKTITSPAGKKLSPAPVHIPPKQIPQTQPLAEKKASSQPHFQPPFDDNHHALVLNNSNTTPSRVANRRNATPDDNTNLSDNNNIAATNNKENTDQTSAAPFRRKMSKVQNINDYVSVNAVNQSYPNGSQHVTFQVQNISDIPVDMIVMDLQYFDANGRFKKGETVYIRNISSNETVNIKAPDDKFSAKITYKVSMVSAEQKGVYLIAD